mmetsp:Transcript_11320/g.18941  ORF Transcript_11320/g.18941 Transcript_11320/m.18941 type:complete len:100 (-) Transcript_11320:102-401(-)
MKLSKVNLPKVMLALVQPDGNALTEDMLTNMASVKIVVEVVSKRTQTEVVSMMESACGYHARRCQLCRARRYCGWQHGCEHLKLYEILEHVVDRHQNCV